MNPATAVSMHDPRIIAWATGYEDLVLGPASTEPAYHDGGRALGPAAGTSFDVVALGDGGRITLTFAHPLENGPGADFAVFENAVNDTFLELAYVEVASDGQSFVRFPCAYRGTEPVSAFGGHDPEWIVGLAGKYRQGAGTPFDLDALRAAPEVAAGALELDHVSHVRLVDIVGDGSALDSAGHVIYDPHPTAQTAGFDLDAIAVLNAAP